MLFLLGFCVFHLLSGAAYVFIMFFTLGCWLVYSFCFSSATVMYTYIHMPFSIHDAYVAFCAIVSILEVYFVRILAHR